MCKDFVDPELKIANRKLLAILAFTKKFKSITNFEISSTGYEA